MKTILSLVTLLCLCAFASVAADAPKGKLFHVVSFKYKSDVTDAQKKEVETAFAALKKSIPQIKSLDYGTNVSPEGFDRGFTHMWVLTFDNAADRDAYLVHSEHKKFGKQLGGKLAEGGVFVVDFVSKE
ncbi:MAG TPA: Dabb family protein [Candidatus Acidoferrum sp.]|nr:Dabb family protein [Candidatus Acidoferrum sp.]